MGNAYGNNNGDIVVAVVILAFVVILYGGVCGGVWYIETHKNDEKEKTRNIIAGGWSFMSLMVWAITIYHHKYIYSKFK